MRIDQVRCFLAVAEEGNLRRAAARLHVSPSAASRSIKDLEDRLGTSLFIRGTRGLQLTPAGVEFTRRSRSALASLELLSDVGRQDGRPQRRTLRVGVAESLPTYPVDVLRTAVARYADPEQGSELVLRTGTSAELMEEVEAGRVDLCLARLPVVKDALVALPIGAMLWQVAVSADHPLAGRSQVSLADLAGHGPVVIPRDLYPRGADPLADRLTALGAEPVQPRSDHPQAVAHRVRAGEWVTVVPHVAYGGCQLVYLDRGFTLLALDDPLPEWSVGVVWRADSPVTAWAPSVAERLARCHPQARLELAPSPPDGPDGPDGPGGPLLDLRTGGARWTSTT